MDPAPESGDPGACTPPPGNHAPRFIALHDTTATIGDTLFVGAAARDADGDPLRYRAVVALASWRPVWLPLTWFNRSTGDFAYIPRPGDGVRLEVSFTVDDGRCGRDERIIRMGVAPGLDGSGRRNP